MSKLSFTRSSMVKSLPIHEVIAIEAKEKPPEDGKKPPLNGWTLAQVAALKS